MSKPLELFTVEFSSQSVWQAKKIPVIKTLVIKALGLTTLAWVFVRYQNPHLDFYWLSGFALCR
jgi:hypothetical protein